MPSEIAAARFTLSAEAQARMQLRKTICSHEQSPPKSPKVRQSHPKSTKGTQRVRKPTRVTQGPQNLTLGEYLASTKHHFSVTTKQCVAVMQAEGNTGPYQRTQRQTCMQTSLTSHQQPANKVSNKRLLNRPKTTTNQEVTCSSFTTRAIVPCCLCCITSTVLTDWMTDRDC